MKKMIIKNMTIGEWGNCKALFSIEIDDVWISGFKIIETNGEKWVACPSRKNADDEYKDIVGMTKEKKTTLTQLAMRKYMDLPQAGF